MDEVCGKGLPKSIICSNLCLCLIHIGHKDFLVY